MNTASYVTLRKLVHPGQQQQQCSLIDSEVPPSPVKLMEPLPLQVTSEGRQSTTTFSTQSLVCQPCMFTNSYHYRWLYPPTPIQRSTQEISFGMSCSLIPSIFPPYRIFVITHLFIDPCWRWTAKIEFSPPGWSASYTTEGDGATASARVYWR